MATQKLHTKKALLYAVAVIVGSVACCTLVYAASYASPFVVKYGGSLGAATSTAQPLEQQVLDTHAYDLKLLALAHVATSSPWHEYFLTGTTTGTTTVKKQPWPVKTTYPNSGALLPANRIVAYYGNFYSKGMGVLGQYPTDVMIPKLLAAVAQWKAADPDTPVIPAIDYIAVTAQGSAGKDGMYRLRMPDSQVDHAVELAKQINGIVILDIQVGLSSVQAEVPQYEAYLSMPNVHLALDPEFDMYKNIPPGKVIGTMSSADINWAATYLAQLVKKNNLPPKILVIHRFTHDMVTGYKNISPLPEVQIVMDMDGWGFGAKKINTYNSVVASEPVQFTGFKLFYKNDLLPPSKAMLTPAEVLNLKPAPSFIQYQ